MLNDISSITPVWGNYYQYLPMLVKNLKQIGFMEYHIYFVSPEPEKVKEQVDSYPHINVLHLQSKNVSELRNYAAEVAKTPYLCFSDADDLAINPGFLKVYKEMQKNPEAAFATAFMKAKNGREYAWPKKWFWNLPPKLKTLVQPAFNNVPFANGTVVCREAFLKMGGFPVWEKTLAEDGALATLMMLNYPTLFLDQPSRIYNVHHEGICQKGHSFQTWQRQCKYLREYLHSQIQTPAWFRPLIKFYTLPHFWYAWHLARHAKHNA